MPNKKQSKVFDFLKRVVKDWDRIPIRIFQDGKWQDLFLSKISSDRAIADWIVTTLQDSRYGKR